METPENNLQNAPESAAKPLAGTSTRAKCFKKHCLRCRKYFNHRHTPAEFNKPCALCPCTYFYGWEQTARRLGFSKEEWAARRKKAETTTEKII